MSNVSRNVDVAARLVKQVEGKPLRGEVRTKPLISGDKMLLLEMRYPTGAAAPLHVHQHETLCYVVSGKIKAIVAGEEYILGPGDTCRHPQGVPHGVEVLEEATVLEIKSPAQPLDQFLATTA